MRSINEGSIWPLLGNLKGNLVKKLRVVQPRVLLCNINAKQNPPQIIRFFFLTRFIVHHSLSIFLTLLNCGFKIHSTFQHRK